MDAQLRKVMDEAVRLDVNGRIGVASEAVGRIIGPLVEAGNSKDDITSFFIAITKMFVSADKSCDDDEYNLFCKATGINMSTDDFFDMTNYGSNEEFISNLLDVIHPLSPDVRQAICIYGIMLVSSNRSLSSDEIRIIERVIAA